MVSKSKWVKSLMLLFTILAFSTAQAADIYIEFGKQYTISNELLASPNTSYCTFTSNSDAIAQVTMGPRKLNGGFVPLGQRLGPHLELTVYKQSLLSYLSEKGYTDDYSFGFTIYASDANNPNGPKPEVTVICYRE